MSRTGLVLAGVLAALVGLPATGAAQCDRAGQGDICAGGSAWYDFTRVRIQPRDRSEPALTVTRHPQEEFSIDVGGGKAAPGRMLVIGGRALLIRDVPLEEGWEIDVLDSAVLMSQLVVTLLDQAFPAGPDAVSARHDIRVEQKTRAIRIATSSAEGRFEAPWRLTGTARRRNGRIEYAVRFTAPTDDGPFALDATGYWSKEPSPVPVDDHMPLAGWSVHWLGPMTMTSEQGTAFDYVAGKASEHWKDVAALRQWISERPDKAPREKR